jgi:hypothetical protein
MLASAWVVPLVIWDTSEIAPPSRDGYMKLADAETGAARSLWVNAALRQRWENSVAARRHALDQLFGSRNLRALYLKGGFSPEALSRYFLEVDA